MAYQSISSSTRQSVSSGTRQRATIKKITGIDIDFNDIKEIGETRRFTVTGTSGAMFSLEVKNEDGYYYNFQTNLFQAAITRLSNISISGVGYSKTITFPKVTDADQYDFYLFAESIYDTVHSKYREVRFPDDSININSSSGSNSNLVQKVIYQTLDVDITINGYSPESLVTGASTSATITTSRGKGVGKIPFSFTWTVTSTRTLSIDKQPESKDITTLIAATVGATPVDIPGEDIYPTARDAFTGDDINGEITSGSVVRMDNTDLSEAIAVGDRITTTVTTDTVDGDSNDGKVVMDNNVATKMAVGDRITAAAGTELGKFLNANVVTVAALNPDTDNVKEFSFDLEPNTPPIADGVTLTFSSKINRSVTTVTVVETSGVATDFTMSQAIQFRDDCPLTFSPQRNYRWPISSTTVDLSKIKPGMRQVKSSFFETQPTVKDYITKTTVFEGEKGEYKIDDVRVPGLETKGIKPIETRDATTKVKTATIGTATNPINITFNEQALLTFGGGTNAKIFGYGTTEVKRLTGYDVEFSDLRATLTEISTTTTAAVSARTSVPITNRAGIMDNISTVTGIGIDSSVRVPKVTSGAGSVTGAGTIVLTNAQTLEDGITLTFPGAGSVATITGNVKVNKVGNEDVSLRFDIEKFLTMH